MRRWLEKRGEAALDAILAYVALRLVVIVPLVAVDCLAHQSLHGLVVVIAALLVCSTVAISKKTPELGL